MTNQLLAELEMANRKIKELEEEVENLREEDWAWHQILKTQNKREYRSKFLKDFQKEYGTNVFPDYDEIYKRYDKMKKENEKLKEQLKYNDLIFKALYKSFSDHEEYENYELLKELESCYENKDIIWLQKFAGEDKQ